RSDGFEYEVEADAEVVDGVATATVLALTAGIDGNTDAGTSVTLVQPVDDVSSAGEVGEAGIAGGVDAETDDDLRARLMQRIQEPPRGGAVNDYERWALEVSGVTRAWVYPGHLGIGTVGVTFVMDNNDPIIPDAAA